MNEPAMKRGQLVASSAVDPIDAALSAALTEAATAGRFDVVTQLAEELGAEEGTSAGNVFVLPGRTRSAR